ncbi:hypothetical protein DN412_41240 [Cupriavidus lacunae]|uniref:Uncharacterized protein n=1 Tax=Cupriavidus lacunae TaxID=2666307 RepID=A0A370MYJ9_9BURK|nr:hypothetical protein DN412_41240 [Cupriavidus lacunae]
MSNEHSCFFLDAHALRVMDGLGMTMLVVPRAYAPWLEQAAAHAAKVGEDATWLEAWEDPLLVWSLYRRLAAKRTYFFLRAVILCASD